MKRLGMGLVGPGFIAAHHIDAVRRLGDVDIVAIAGSSQQSANLKAIAMKVSRAYGDYMDLIRDADVDVVHNTTPNHLHFAISMAAIEAGKYVISDKPLAVTPEQARRLRDAASESGKGHVMMFNYRGTPVVQQARSMIKSGELGALNFIHGFYLQDWMADAGIYSWRSDPARGGVSSSLADIGSHWLDLAQHVSGSQIKSVLADLTTIVPTRYKDGQDRSTSSPENTGKGNGVSVQGEDLASVLLRFDGGAKGCFSAGQVAVGHKNDLQLELNGRSGSLRWEQEIPNDLWLGRYGEPNTTITKDPAQLVTEARRYATLPAGHQGGWADAFYNIMNDAYTWIRQGSARAERPPATATFEDGYRICCIIDAILRSHAAGGVWQEVVCVSRPGDNG